MESIQHMRHLLGDHLQVSLLHVVANKICTALVAQETTKSKQCLGRAIRTNARLVAFTVFVATEIPDVIAKECTDATDTK